MPYDHGRTCQLHLRLLAGALVATGVLLTVAAVKTPWSIQPRWLIAVCGAGASVALWEYRRWPVAVTALGALSYALSGNPWALAVGLFATAYTLRQRRLALASGAALVGFASPDWIETGRLSVDAVTSAVLATVVVAVTGRYLGTRQALLGAVRERAETADAERQLRMERARSNERARIAREMHDVLAHKLSLIALHSGALEVNAAAGPAPVEKTASLIRTTARDALGELRDILGLLRDEPAGERAPATPEHFADLAQLVTEWTQAGADVSLDDQAGPLPPATARAAYRLVQEGLTNAHKHAPGTPVTVAIAGGHGCDIIVTVKNRCTREPRNATGTGGFGLVGLAERARLVGGSVRVGPDAHGHWCLEGRMPWVPAEHHRTERAELRP